MKFKNSDMTVANTKICFGASIFCKMFLFPLMAFIDKLIVAVKYLNTVHYGILALIISTPILVLLKLDY